MNTITVGDIKRSGFAALDVALQRGPVQLMKRNRPGAVVMRPQDYERMARLASQAHAGEGSRALQMLTGDTGKGRGLAAAAMQARLAEMSDAWANR